MKFDNFTATPILSEIKFWRIQTVQNVISGNFRDSELWILVNFWVEICSNLLKSEFKTSKIGINNIFKPFELPKIGFYIKSEWWYIDQISTKSSLNFTFWKFLEHSGQYGASIKWGGNEAFLQKRKVLKLRIFASFANEYNEKRGSPQICRVTVICPIWPLFLRRRAIGHLWGVWHHWTLDRLTCQPSPFCYESPLTKKWRCLEFFN